MRTEKKNGDKFLLRAAQTVKDSLKKNELKGHLHNRRKDKFNPSAIKNSSSQHSHMVAGKFYTLYTKLVYQGRDWMHKTM